MEFVVLVKAVPAVETLAFDPAARTVRRDLGPLFPNPFDQRAIRVALEARRPGEGVTALSMGPPEARSVLREARAVGVDRAILISDPAFAGSDSLATATALAAAVGQLRPGVVLAGAWTTDSETGQVGPELAALLGWPVVTNARALRRTDGPPGFEIVVDTATGWLSCEVPTPVVITVGEKIAKPLRPAPDALAGVDEASIEEWTAADLGIAPGRTGSAGSPTIVVAVTLTAPTRTSRRFEGGTVADRVRGAVEALAPRLGPAPAPALPLPPAPVRRTPDRESVVLVTDRHGRLDLGSLGAVVAVRRRVVGGWPSVLWIGAAPTEEETVLLERAGALAGYLVRTPARQIGPVAAARVTEELLGRRPELAAAVFAAGPFGRDVAATVAGHRRLGLVGDAIDLSAEDPGHIVWTKPSFGGRTVAAIRCRSRPNLATVRGEAFSIPERGPSGGFGWEALSILVPSAAGRTLGEGVEVEPSAGLGGRDVVVAVGMGIGGPEGVARLAPTLVRWGAGLAATRRVVDAGWVPRQLQVGLTGRSLAPRLAVLLGISGSVHHAVGWRRAGTVLAVNRDPAAPVFLDADVGIVGAVEEVLPMLEGSLAHLLGR